MLTVVRNTINALLRKDLNIFGERVVEYPFVLQNLQGKKVLDVGCSGSSFPIIMAGMGYDVIGIDISGYSKFNHPNFRFVRADVTKDNMGEKFNSIVSVSTLEHIDADKLALEKMKSFLSNSGVIILTIPFGQNHRQFKGWRVYDKKSVKNLLSGFTIRKANFYKRVGENWVECSQEDVNEHRDGDRCMSVACFVLR